MAATSVEARDPRRSVARVVTKEGETAGTAFLLHGGLLVTAAHVAEGAGGDETTPINVALRVNPGRTVTAEPRAWLPADGIDLAVFALPASDVPSDAAPLVLGSSRDLGTASSLRTFGFPRGKGTMGTPATCAWLGETNEPSGVPQVALSSNQVTEFFSGAPVIDEDQDAVVGVVETVLSPDRIGKGGESCFMRPVESLWELCLELSPEEPCPYRGLEVFDTEHYDLYFGRDPEIERLLQMLRDQDVVSVIGVSGAGKSSLARAGLEKGIRRAGATELAQRARVVVVPGRNPVLNLVMGACSAAGIARSAFLENAGVQPGQPIAGILDQIAPEMVSAGLQKTFRAHGLLLIIDQFERLYTEAVDDAQARFIEVLEHAVAGDIKVVITLRADFYGRALESRSEVLTSALGGFAQLTLTRMTKPQLRETVVGPARLRHRGFQPGVPERLVDDVADRAGDLPLLELALTELWTREGVSGVMTHCGYEALGYTGAPGVRGVVAQRAERLWAELDDEQRAALERLFVMLALGFSDAEQPKTEVYAGRQVWLEADLDEASQELARRLAEPDLRLLTLGKDAETGAATVEVVHEALLRSWDRIRAVIRSAPDFRRWYSRIRPALQRWSSDHGGYELLRGPQLAEAQQWLAQRPEWLRGTPMEFIQASVRAAEEELDRARRAERQARLAVSRYLAIRARALLDESFELAVLISAQATLLDPTVESRAVLRDALQHRPRMATLLPHERAVRLVLLSPDRRYLGTLESDGPARIWDLRGPRLVAELAPNSALDVLGRLDRAHTSDMYVPGGRMPTGDTVVALSGSLAWEIAFATTARDAGVAVDSVPGIGQFEATTSDRRENLCVKDLNTGVHREMRISVSGGGGWAVSENGDYVAWIGPTGQSVDVFDLGTQSSRHHQLRLEPFVAELCVAVGPDGAIATGGESQSVSVRRPEQVTVRDQEELGSHEAAVVSLCFGSDGELIASGGRDGRAIVWRRRMPEWPPLARPFIHPQACVAFAGEYQLLCVSFKQAAMLDLESGDTLWRYEPPLAQPWIQENWARVSVSNNGAVIAWATGTNEIILWDVRQRDQIGAIAGAFDVITLSGDGTRLAASGGGGVTVWDVHDQSRVWSAQTPARCMALNRDGTLLALDGFNVVDVSSGKKHAEITPPALPTALAFSSDSQYLACGIETGQVMLHELSSSSDPALLRLPPRWPTKLNAPKLFPTEGAMQAGRIWPVHGLSFSHDGTMLAACADHNAAALWLVATGQPFGDGLTAHPEWRVPDGGKHWCVRSAAFNDADTAIATSAYAEVHYRAASRARPDDEAILIWDMDVASWRRRAYSLVNRELSETEWRELVGPEIPYQPVGP